MATRIGPISCVTIAAPELQRSIDLYRLHLGYEFIEHGRVPPALARIWGRPGLTGRPYAWMLPGGAGQTGIRFVESRPDPAYRAFRHMGWNAAEIMVQDTDACAARLAGTPFTLIGPPADLSFSDKIRAMQVLGPSGEALYLTSFKEKLAAFDTPEARHFIDRVFIVIVGGESVAALNAWYSAHFGLPAAPVIPSRISVLSDAHGLPSETRHDLAALTLSGQSFIEADTMPPGTLPRGLPQIELPPAISMVAFDVASLPGSLSYLGAPEAIDVAPYRGRRAAVCVGAAGELVELIDSP